MAYILKQQTVNGKIHLYWAESVYRKGQTPGQIRKYIGVLNPGNHELLKNRKLADLDSRILSALRKAGIEYKGTAAPAPGRIPKMKRNSISSCITYEAGRVAVLQELAEEAGLDAVLSEAFGAEAGQEILAVAMYQCCEGTALYLGGDWLNDTILGERHISLSSSSISRLCTKIGENDALRNDFFRDWIKQCKYPRALVHDTTSFSSYAEKINAVEWGYNRDREDLPQINYGLVYAKETQLPLFYRLIPGSITDVATLATTSAMLMELGLKNFSYSLDRGYFSTANLWELLKNKLDFNIGLPMNGKTGKLLDEHRRQLNSAGSLIGGKEFSIHHAEAEYELRALGKGRPHILQAHIYCDEQKLARQKTELNVLLLEIMRAFESEHFTSRYDAEEWCEQHMQGKRELFKLNGHRAGNITLKISEKAFAEAVKDMGVFMLLTSKPTDGMEALMINKKRDAAEKIFDTLKNSIGDGRLHGFSDENIAGRLFLAFITAILHSLMENRLRKYDLLNTKYTVPSALALLRKIKVTVGADGTRIPNEIPKKVQTLLNEMKVELKNV